MKNNITELVFVLDRSESMVGVKCNTIGGAIHHIGSIHKYARNENKPEHLQTISTDI